MLRVVRHDGVCSLLIFLFLCTPTVSVESTLQPPHKFIASPCGSPMTINFTGVYNAYEAACTQFQANSHLDIINISFEFDDIKHMSSPADLDLTITSLKSHLLLHVGGWDDDNRKSEDMEWPNEWQQSTEPGIYFTTFDVHHLFLDDDGVYEICLMNKWLYSGQLIYNGLIQLQGMISDCSLTQSPTVTPEITTSSSSDCVGSGIDVVYDISYTGSEKKCMTPFFAQGDLSSVDVTLRYTPKQMYIGVVSIQQSMWPSDVELSLTQLSSNQSVIIGYDALDNEFLINDDGVDADNGSYFNSMSLNGVTDLMDASKWLSPSSSLTASMITDVESCDQNFCSKFSSTTFMSSGSAVSNEFYPRYIRNMTAPFTINAQILKNYACDDHFMILSRLPLGSTFRYGVQTDTITFAWDCNHKFIYAETAERVGGEHCGGMGQYNVEIGIDSSGYAFFRDDVCGEMKVLLDDASGPWYLFIGSDNDNSGTLVNQNDFVSKGLNRYHFEWPQLWATNISGDYTASFQPTDHNFEHIGEYQLCLANVWGGYSFADISGEVLLPGLQTCDALVCAPGDRVYCSHQGVCRTDGTGCDCDDNREFSPTDICASSSSNSDKYLFGYKHSVVLISCLCSFFVLLCLALVGYYIMAVNNKQHDTRGSDVVVESIDLTDVESVCYTGVQSNKKQNYKAIAKDLMEIPAFGSPKVRLPQQKRQREKPVSPKEKRMHEAFQVPKRTPNSPDKPGGRISPRRRASPPREDSQQHVSSSEIKLTLRDNKTKGKKEKTTEIALLEKPASGSSDICSPPQQPVSPKEKRMHNAFQVPKRTPQSPVNTKVTEKNIAPTSGPSAIVHGNDETVRKRENDVSLNGKS